MANVSSNVGRHLDLHRHARDFHFAIPTLRSFSPHDRHVGSKDCRSRSRPALYHASRNSVGVSWRKGAPTMMKTPFGHKVYAMAAEYPSAAALYEAAKRRSEERRVGKGGR